MKTFVQILLLTSLLSFTGLHVSNAQVSAGVGLAFGSEIEQVGIQGDLNYRFASLPAVMMGAGFTYYFPKNNQDFYEVNLNGAYIFYEEFMFKSYAYTGLNYARSKVSFGNDSVSETAFGLNIGIGAEYDFGPLFAFGDLKYVISEFDQPVFTLGIRVPFGR